MPRMSKKKRKHELSFFTLNDRGRVTYKRIMPEMPAWVQAELPGGCD